MNRRVVYTSDMHGNEKQYETFVEYALENKPGVVIIGGELPPKGRITEGYPKMQRDFLSQRLPTLLLPIKENHPDTQIYVLPGNDDCAVNDEVLNAHPDLFTNIDRKRVVISGGLEIVGYSPVPITPFSIKDREKFDLTDIPASYAKAYSALQKATYNLSGIRSVMDDITSDARWEKFRFVDEDRINSIQKDLESELFRTNPQGTIYVFHTPPQDTPLDVIYGDFDKMHVGSFAVRQFIKQQQPFLTLHGHIHETVDASGEYADRVGNSVAMSAGNHNEDSKLSILTFDLDNLSSVERIKLPCSSFGKFTKKMFGKIK